MVLHAIVHMIHMVHVIHVIHVIHVAHMVHLLHLLHRRCQPERVGSTMPKIIAMWLTTRKLMSSRM